MIYYGAKISPNITETKEGYLIAMNVPIARIGKQRYLPSEVDVDNPEEYSDSDGMVTVIREPDEVFSAATIASFEGKPTVDGHPSTGSTDGLVDASNESFYRKGHMQNIRRGTGEFSDNLVADIFITDPQLIKEVHQKAKREVSCGYTCDWIPENGKVYQRNIRGNHIAIVPRGRAGSDVAIHDSMPPQAGRRKETMARETILNRIFGLGFKQYAADAEPEELTQLMEPEKPKVPTDETPAGGGDVDSKFDRIMGILEQLVKSDKEVHAEIPKEGMDALDSELGEKTGDPEPDPEPDNDGDDKSKTLEEGEPTEDCSSTGDSAILDYVRSRKPIVAKMPAGAAKDAAVNELLAMVRAPKPSGNVYGAIVKATQTHHAHDAKPENKTISQKAETFVGNCKAAREGGK